MKKYLFIILLLVCIAPKISLAAFSYKASIVVDHTQVINADQTNFPMLVSGTYAGAGGVPDLRTVGNGGKVQNSNGYDIQFFSDSGLTTRLPAERESYNASTGAVNFWVKKTLLTASNTTIYIAYGDASISTDPNADATYGTTSVWDANYRIVMHLADGTTLSGADSSSYGNNATTVTATPTAGKVDGAAAFNGTTQEVGRGFTASTNFTGPETLEAWFNEADNSNYRAVITVGGTSTRSGNMYLVSGTLNQIYYNNVGAQTLSSSWTLNTWNHLVSTDDGTNLKIYLNGALAYSGTNGVGASGSFGEVGIGYNTQDSSFPMQGSIDEARISASVRDANWIATEYNNQNSPSAFYTMGSETSNGSTVPGAPTIGTATAGNAQATVTFTANGNGGSAITGYTVTSTPGGGTDSNAGSTGLSHVVTGLTNGTSYTFTVHATNINGNSAESGASNAAIPSTIPGAPTIGTATGGNAQATVTFTANGNGGSAITGYTVTSSPGGGTDSNAGSTSLSHVVTGLTNGTPYTFTVHATNINGNSAESSASNSVTPTSGGAPAPTGGGPLTTGYVYDPNNTNPSSVANNTPANDNSNMNGVLPPPIVPPPPIITPVTPPATIPPVVVSDCTGADIFSTLTGQPCAPGTPINSTHTTYNFGKTNLVLYSRGESVKELQRFLNKSLNAGLIVDGVFGLKTLYALEKWQKMNGLVADGVVGPKTKLKMNSSSVL